MPTRAVTDAEITKAAKTAGIPENVLRAMLFRGERSGASATSPKGAYGQAQLMPGTARRLEQDYGIKTNTPYGNVLGGAYYLAEQKRTFGTWRKAFAAYNAGPGAVKQYGGVPPYRETQDYVERVMTFLKQDARMGPQARPVNAPAGAPMDDTTAPAAPAVPTGPTKEDVAMQGLAALAQGRYDPMAGLAALSQAASQAAPAATAAAPTYAPPVEEPQVPTRNRKTPKGGWVVVPPRRGQWPGPGPEVVGFVSGLAQAYGKQLAVWDTSTHSRMTTSGRVSAHTDRRALDVPAEGAKLTRLGYLALRRAGMGKAQALKAARKGGLYNVGDWQIIFKTDIGGNHYDHLHVGRRG